MKINNKLVKHYVHYDISMLTEQEREELAKEVNNWSVKNPLCNEITKADETPDSRWLASMTRMMNSVSIRTILEQETIK